MKELKQLKKKLLSKYGEPNDPLTIRMWNTYTLRWLFKTNLITLFGGLELKNNIDEKIYVRSEPELSVILSLGDEEIMSITKLVKNKNKYGSSIFKRFFKYYDGILIEKLFSLNEMLLMVNYDWIMTCKDYHYNRIYVNIYGDRIKIIDKVIYLETSDQYGTKIVITNPDNKKIMEFCRYVNIIDKVKATNIG